MTSVFPELPTLHAGLAILLTVVALFLFTRKGITLEVSSIAILAIISMLFTFFPFSVDGRPFEAAQFFSGFGHQALVTVCALMVIGQGLIQTGALEPFGRVLTKAWRYSPALVTLVMLALSALLSAFINNTPIVVLLLPILISISLRTKTSPSKILLPMGFATTVGGMTTTIGTSTNLLVVSVASDMGLPRMEMFDFFVPAIMGSGVAILYLWLIAPLLLKDREMNLSDDSLRIFQARVNLEEGSLAIGKTVAEAQSLIGEEVTIVRIRRGNTYILPLPDVVLKAGDRIRLSGTTTNINAAADSLKATLYAEEKITDEDHPLWAENQQLAEIAIVNGSLLDGTTLRNTNFLEKFQLIVLALHRSGRDIWQAHEEIMDVTLEHGDVLLVQGSRDMIHNLKVSPDFLVLDASKEVPHTEKALTALLIMAGVVVVAALNLLPILMSSIAGVLLMLLTRCLDLDQAFRALSASVILVVVASLAIGQALQVTGATLYITDVFLYVFGNSSPAVIMSGLMLLIGILTNIVSNNAAAVIGTPIAVSIAQQLNVPTEPFILAVLFGANLSFATPMSYNTNLLVMSAGNYSFNDFVKVGAPLTLLMWAVYSYILSSLYLL